MKHRNIFYQFCSVKPTYKVPHIPLSIELLLCALHTYLVRYLPVQGLLPVHEETSFFQKIYFYCFLKNVLLHKTNLQMAAKDIYWYDLKFFLIKIYMVQMWHNITLIIFRPNKQKLANQTVKGQNFDKQLANPGEVNNFDKVDNKRRERPP
jgi:hypothetical protein